MEEEEEERPDIKDDRAAANVHTHVHTYTDAYRRKGTGSRREKRGSREKELGDARPGGCRGFRGSATRRKEQKTQRRRTSRKGGGRCQTKPASTTRTLLGSRSPGKTSVSSFNQKDAGPTCCPCRSPRERRATGSVHLQPCASPLLVSSSPLSPSPALPLPPLSQQVLQRAAL